MNKKKREGAKGGVRISGGGLSSAMLVENRGLLLMVAARAIILDLIVCCEL